MDAKEKLIREKNLLLRKIAESAQRSQSQEVLIASEKLQKIERLIERYEQLLNDMSDLDATDLTSLPTRNVSVKLLNPYNHKVVPGRGIGKTIRMDFLKKVGKAGLQLEQMRGSVYGTQSGRKVGVAVATERKPNRWFLGLPIGIDQAVLLCQSESGDVATICLPKDFFAEYGDKMSKSGGQMKFNVMRRGSGYSLLIPGTDGVNVSRFVEDYSQLK
ncbi:MAG: hypothetical protein JW944_02515 [Deltaproteobacteria bacterium]|nr:hypothetical protein [Deltaproteobacteria bacterium]